MSLALRLTDDTAVLHFLQVMSSDRVSLVSNRAGSRADSVRLHMISIYNISYLVHNHSIASLNHSALFFVPVFVPCMLCLAD